MEGEVGNRLKTPGKGLCGQDSKGSRAELPQQRHCYATKLSQPHCCAHAAAATAVSGQHVHTWLSGCSTVTSQWRVDRWCLCVTCTAWLGMFLAGSFCLALWEAHSPQEMLGVWHRLPKIVLLHHVLLPISLFSAP